MKKEIEESKPYVLTICNASDNKHYEVPIFTENPHKDLKYLSEPKNIEYNNILLELKDKPVIFGQIRMLVFCDYQKVVKKQLACQLIVKFFYKYERIVKIFEFHLDSYQQIEYQSDIILGHKWYSDITNLKEPDFTPEFLLSYLMPDTTVKLYLYPAIRNLNKCLETND